MFRRRTIRGPVTGLFHTPVCTVRPRQDTSIGRPTFRDSSVAIARLHSSVRAPAEDTPHEVFSKHPPPRPRARERPAVGSFAAAVSDECVVIDAGGTLRQSGPSPAERY